MLNCLLAAMVAGILFMENFSPTLKTFLGICASVTVGIILATWKKNSATVTNAISLIIFFIIGATRFYAADNLPATDISKFEGQNLKIVGTVRDEPQIKILPNEISLPYKPA